MILQEILESKANATQKNQLTIPVIPKLSGFV